MFTPKQMELLRKTSTSVDSEKSKKRITEDFKSTTKAQKDQITNLSGLSNNAFYNIGKTGAASPKVVLSLAQILNVSPRFYSGEIDEREPCTDEVLNEFYKKYANKNAPRQSGSNKDKQIDKKNIPEKTIKRKSKSLTKSVKLKNNNEKNINATKNEDKVTSQIDNSIKNINIDFDNSKKMKTAINELNEDSAILLLKALLKRGEAGGKAEILSDIVKYCLLS